MGTPWETVGEGASGELHELRHAAQALAIAAMQVAQTGTKDQLGEAKAILEDARRGLYRLLAGDAAGEDERPAWPTPTWRAAIPQATPLPSAASDGPPPSGPLPAALGGQQLARVQHPGRIEARLHGAQHVDAQLADLGGQPRRVVGADGVVVGQRRARAPSAPP